MQWYLYSAGLERLIAKNEDEYVQLALQLASDFTALSNLRMSLRDLMAKSPVCDGPNFARGLELTYRDMWRRYCKGDVPSLRHMEILQHVVPEEPITKISKEGPLNSIKSNGFNVAPPSTHLSSGEENGVQSTANLKASWPKPNLTVKDPRLWDLGDGFGLDL